MLSLPPSVRVYLCTGVTDMRKSIDGLASLVQETFGEHPCSGHLFLFRNRRSDRVKILVWDANGFWLLYKRIERGRVHFPLAPDGTARVTHAELTLLLAGIDLAGATHRRSFTPRSAPRLG